MKKILNKLCLFIIMGILVVPANLVVYAEEEKENQTSSSEVETSGTETNGTETSGTETSEPETSGTETGGEGENNTSSPEEEKLSSEAKLSSVKITVGVKSSTMNSNYQHIVASKIEEVKITATAVENGKVSSDDCNLDNTKKIDIGENTCTIKVTSEDGKNDNEYKITVIRATDNLNLKSINTKGVFLNETFDAKKTDYTLDVSNNISKLKELLSAAAEDPNASVSITGTTNLKVGKNTVKITVKNQAGESKEYRIVVTRAPEDEITTSDDNPDGEENNVSDIDLSGDTITSDNTTIAPVISEKDDDSNNNSNLDLTSIIVILISVILIIIAGIGIYFYVITGNSEKNRQRKIAKLKKKQSKIEEQLTGLMPVITEDQSSNYLKQREERTIRKETVNKPVNEEYKNEDTEEYKVDDKDLDLEDTIEMDAEKINSNNEEINVKEKSDRNNILDDFDDLFIDE